MTEILSEKPYIKYAKDVLSGEITTCHNIYLACKRTLSWFSRDDIYFDYQDVDKKIRFIHSLKHFTGQHNGKHFDLLPWQSWVVAEIFGWKYKDTGLRVTSKALIFISRKNGKTALASAIALAGAVCDNEPNAEIDFVANNRQQANIAFDFCRNYAASIDPKHKVIKQLRQELKIDRTKSKLQVLSSDSMGLDGYNSHITILDELHAMKKWDLYNVMLSSMGARRQPLMICVTTAGFLLQTYPCFEMRQMCVDILNGLKEDDTQFSALYELDEDDNWQDENVWVKCSPSLGQTVSYKYMRDQITLAKNQPSQETGVKTKNLNMFCSSKDIWISDKYILGSLSEVNLQDYEGEQCYIGVDLSTVSDMSAVSIMIPPNELRKLNPDKFIFKVLCYLPESALTEAFNAETYRQWKRHNNLTVTPGNVIDYDYILKDILAINDTLFITEIDYDTYNATQWAIDATEAGLNLEPYSQALGNFNKPTKFFEILLKSNRIIIDSNPIIRWMLNNVELKYDHANNCKPFKAGNDKNKKIDGVIGMLEALGGFLNNNTNFSFKAFGVG